MTAPALTYTPAANYNGPDSFTFKANDGTADSNVATVTITVTAVNDAPVAANGSLTTSEDMPASGMLVASDIDKRKKFAKTLMQGAAFEFAPLNDGELTTWARAHLKELKTEVEADVLRRIVELVRGRAGGFLSVVNGDRHGLIVLDEVRGDRRLALAGLARQEQDLASDREEPLVVRVTGPGGHSWVDRGLLRTPRR